MDRLQDISAALDVDIAKLIEGAESFLGVNIDELDTVKIPIVEKASFVKDAFMIDEIDSYEETPRSWVQNGEFFFVRAKGDSMMNARILNGDLVLIKKQNEVHEGEIAAVLVKGDIQLRRVFKSNNFLLLQSENPNNPPIMIEKNIDNEAVVIGKVTKIVINM